MATKLKTKYKNPMENMESINDLIKELGKNALAIKRIEDRDAEVREKLLKEMKKRKVDGLETDHGLVAVCHRTTWTYSEDVVAEEALLNAHKGVERDTGLAKPSKGDGYIKYTLPKRKRI